LDKRRAGESIVSSGAGGSKQGKQPSYHFKFSDMESEYAVEEPNTKVRGTGKEKTKRGEKGQ
jgi:hypothetical protein